ncbi:hypothetical protein BAY61_11545 [Prauserella marina]|uniref:GOLPH3/VPS74 family protein n=1 Tax=Prauserella marina TaxID=530584 RepID=UPI000B8D27BA|nr:GPP34 family phosphoprotein [Prauserella marina]ASR39190.1 hypothetical protein BAY61_11545 [Prauserella marina]
MNDHAGSLPAQCYLLACDPQRHTVPDRHQLGLLMRGAVLAELLLSGALTDDNGFAGAAGSVQSSGVLGDVLGEVAASKPRRWGAWIRKGWKPTLNTVEADLREHGVIDVTTKTVLGIVVRRRVTILDEPRALRLRAVVTDAVQGTGEVSLLTERDALLAGLATAVELKTTGSVTERWRLRRRIADIQRRGEPVVPALRAAFGQLRAARTSGGGGGA